VAGPPSGCVHDSGQARSSPARVRIIASAKTKRRLTRVPGPLSVDGRGPRGALRRLLGTDHRRARGCGWSRARSSKPTCSTTCGAVHVTTILRWPSTGVRSQRSGRPSRTRNVVCRLKTGFSFVATEQPRSGWRSPPKAGNLHAARRGADTTRDGGARRAVRAGGAAGGVGCDRDATITP
jgi:hypothetical protein